MKFYIAADVACRRFMCLVSCGLLLPGPKHTVLRFVVKFFPPDHAQLLEEFTR